MQTEKIGAALEGGTSAIDTHKAVSSVHQWYEKNATGLLSKASRNEFLSYLL